MTPGQEEETVIEAVLAIDGDQTRLVLEERGLLTDRRTRWTALTPSYSEQTVRPA